AAPSATSVQATTDRPFTASEVASFSTPWAMDFLPGSGVPLTNAALITEREGNLWLVDVTSGKKQAVAGLPNIHVEGQGGLQDVIASPDFAGNQRIYLSFAEGGANGTSGTAVGFGRLILGQGQPRIKGFRTIWRQAPKVTGGAHFAGRLAFSPDGHLFISSGERFQFAPAQDPKVTLGKIVRLTADGAVPPDNPGSAMHGDPAVWTLGHRNPLGLAFAPDGRLWEIEMGPMGGDELNLIVPGKNFGWPKASYGSNYDGTDIPDAHAARGFEEPKLWWNPSVSPGGILIYTGDLFPQWKGDALIGALSGEALIRADLNGDTARKADQWPMGARIRAVDQGPRGEIYVLEDGGRLLRLEPAKAARR
ncbi:MAG: PQQ-dependent sugar dehydrogenase, partial [Sphingomicrobium sp.]